MAWLRQRTDFKIDEFMRIIIQKGYYVTWSKSSICPCITKGGQGQPDFNCPLCFGKGRYYFDPKIIQGIMTSFNQEEQFRQTGEILPGTSYFTTLPENKLGFWDRLTNSHSQARFSEIVIKGDHGTKDKLRFLPVSSIALRTVSVVYEKDKDFSIDTAGYVNWIPTGLEPQRGETYSIDYLMHPQWIVIDLVNVIRDTLVKTKKPGATYQQMPIRALVRLEYFVVV